MGLYRDDFSDGILSTEDWYTYGYPSGGSGAESDGRLHLQSEVGGMFVCQYRRYVQPPLKVTFDWETDFPALAENDIVELLLVALNESGDQLCIGRQSNATPGADHETVYARWKNGQTEIARVDVPCTANSGTFQLQIGNGRVVCLFREHATDSWTQIASFAVSGVVWWTAASAQSQHAAYCAAWVDNFELATTGFSVDSITPDVTSLHAAEVLTIRGGGFHADFTMVTVGDEACTVEVVSANEIRATTPRFMNTGDLPVIVSLPDILANHLLGEVITLEQRLSVRDRFLRILLAATERAWSPTIDSVGYRVLAAIAAGRERSRALALAMYDQALPESASLSTGLPWHDRDLDLEERPELSLAQRRARVRAKLNEQPSLAWGVMLDAVRPYCADEPVLHEVEGYDEYGESIWTLWIEVDEDDISNPSWDWREAERSLRGVKPGFAGAWIGRAGFTPGKSVPGRDAPVEV